MVSQFNKHAKKRAKRAVLRSAGLKTTKSEFGTSVMNSQSTNSYTLLPEQAQEGTYHSYGI